MPPLIFAMADIIRTFEVPNRVPGKLVFGPRRILATFGSIETATPAQLPEGPGSPTVCPPADAEVSEAKGVQAGQAICGIAICIGTSKQIIAFDNFADDPLAIGTAKVVEAFPVVAGNAQSSNAATTSHTVSLPGSIASGDTLIAICAFGGFSGGVTFPAGWTEIQDTNNSGASMAVAYRKADGLEGGSITVTTVSSVESRNTTYRITGASDPTVQSPEIVFSASGSSTTPNPATITPTFPAAHLYIAAYAGAGAGPTTALPASYGNDQSHAGTVIHIGCGDRQLHALSENPGTFTKTGSSFWRAAVIAVFPA